MSLLSLIITIVVVGVVLWAIDSFIPMEASTKTLLKRIVVIVLVVWVLYWVLTAFNLMPYLSRPLSTH